MSFARPTFKKGKGAARQHAPASAGTADATPSVKGFKSGVKSANARSFGFEAHPTNTSIEIIRKRAVMKHAAQQVYNQLGWSVRAHDLSRGALQYLNALVEVASSEDERNLLFRISTKLGAVAEDIRALRVEKIEQARDMEEALEKARRSNRKAEEAILASKRKKAKALDEELLEETEAEVRPKGKRSLTPEEDHPDTARPSVALDPKLVLQAAENEILLKEKAKTTSKDAKNKGVKSEQDED